MSRFLRHRTSTIVLAVMFLMCAQPVLAVATITARAEQSDPQIGSLLNVQLLISTGEQPINAIEGSVMFPHEILTFDHAELGASLVSVWIERPALHDDGMLSFAGIIPGGRRGANQEIGTLVFRVIDIGSATIRPTSFLVLANDGNGSEIPVTVRTTTVTARRAPSDAPAQKSTQAVRDDTTAPEEFTPIIARDPNIFEEKWFLSFSAQDKGAGISHYEVRESSIWNLYRDEWVRAESPHLLSDQLRLSDVSVRAIDHAGNIRVETLPATSRLALILVLIIVFALVLVLVIAKLRS